MLFKPLWLFFILFFFFFQAEDGIRDFHVTGVQTCALPISCAIPGLPCWHQPTTCSSTSPHALFRHPASLRVSFQPIAQAWRSLRKNGNRSEERRVGKECRSRWSPEH